MNAPIVGTEMWVHNIHLVLEVCERLGKGKTKGLILLFPPAFLLGNQQSAQYFQACSPKTKSAPSGTLSQGRSGSVQFQTHEYFRGVTAPQQLSYMKIQILDARD